MNRLLFGIMATALLSASCSKEAWDGQCIWASSTNVSIGDQVEFYTDCYTDVEEYKWEFGDGSEIKNATVSATHTYTKAGSHEVKIKAKIKGGSESSSKITVTVN